MMVRAPVLGICLGFLAAGAVGFAGLSAFCLIHQDGSSASADQTLVWDLPDPLVIPLQAVYDNNSGVGTSSFEDSDARMAWLNALDIFRSASDEAEAARRTASLLDELANRWPDNPNGIRAQLFAINTLVTYAPDFPGIEHRRLEFLERAHRFPRAYFSEDFEASSLWVVVDMVRHFAEQGNSSLAWRVCLQFRWVAPRVDVLTPVCRALIAKNPAVKLSANEPSASLPEPGSQVKLPSGNAGADLKREIQRYRSDPYDGEALAKLIVALKNLNPSQPTDRLLQELVEIDSAKAWEVENAISKMPLHVTVDR